VALLHDTTILPGEKALLHQAAAGDAIAFRQLFDAYRGRVYSFALHLTENTATADEIVQEVFLRVWLYRDKLTEVIHFSAWLHTITRHQVFDALKAQARERALYQGMPEQAASNNVADSMAGKEYELLLRQAVGRLPDRQQLIYHLSRDAGIQHAEIAGRLNISRHTVKTHLVHALKTIRRYLQYHSDGMLVVIILLRAIY
jgi:RNA polymerase sigma-70 factor (ECF subfamily)